MATPRTPRRGKKSDSSTPPEADPALIEDAQIVSETPAGDATVAAPLAEDAPKFPEDPALAAAEAPAEPEPFVLSQPVPAPEPEPEPAATPEPEVAPRPEPDPEPAPVAGTARVQETPSARVQPSGGGGSRFLGLVLGGLIAAGIGFAVARFVVPPDWPSTVESPLKAQIDAQAASLAEVRAGLQALPPAPDLSGLQARIDALDAGLDAALAAASVAPPPAAPDETLIARLDMLESRIAAIETRPAAETSVAPEALGEVEDAVAALRADLDAQKAEAAAAQAALLAEQQKSEAAAKVVLIQGNVAQITAALQSGAPFADTLALLTAEGIEAPAPLPELAETGVPTLAGLTDSYADPARAALETALRADMGDSVTERLGSFLRSQTGARSLTPREGSDPDAILSRAEAAIRAGDLPTALTEIETLPAPAQDALAGWTTQAKLRLAAQEAVTAVAAQLDER